MTLDFFMLLPVAAFFVLNEPHDCFMCFGKDPDRIYSSYQLTPEERAQRHVKAKFSTKEAQRMSTDTRFLEKLLKQNRRRTVDLNNTAVWSQVQDSPTAMGNNTELDEEIILMLSGSICTSEPRSTINDDDSFM